MSKRTPNQVRCAAAVLMALAALGLTAAEPIPPTVLTATARTRDAPEVTPTDHGVPGQNAIIGWTMVGPGTAKGDALYLFPVIPRPEDGPEDTPFMALLSLTDGKLREYFATTTVQIREQVETTDELGDAAAVRETAGRWCWGPPVCGATGAVGEVYLGTAAQEKRAAAVLRFRPATNQVEEVVGLAASPAALVVADGALRILTSDGMLQFYDEIGGLAPVARVTEGLLPGHGTATDDRGWLYVPGPEFPMRLYAVQPGKDAPQAVPLLADQACEELTLHEGLPGPWCEVVVGDHGHFRVARFGLHDGKATPLPAPPDNAALARRRGYELTTDFATFPPAAAVRRPNAEWQRFPIVFSKAVYDKIRCLRGDPGGRYLQVGGWPVAWIWQFDPDTGRCQVHGRHYVFYEMQPWHDELWVVGYWGIKLLRWRTQEPWTFDYDRHYGRKTFPGNQSPWGDRDVSNPRLVCKFRYLKQLEVRRPSGLAFGADGRAYTGAHTPAVEYLRSRYGGALNWYDPATETIGQVREPFLHHSVRDVCTAGDRYIAAVASAYISPYEPLPKDFSDGKFVLYDTRRQVVAVDCSPLGASLSYVEEGEPGRVVGVGGAGRYGGDGIGSALFIFDTNELRVTHVIRLPVRVIWLEYDNTMRFERGPDRRIYFYGKDADGIAMFRADSRTGQVEPVLRAHLITDAATYNNLGAPFTFFRDRLWCGATHLTSIPLAAIIKPAAPGGAP